MTVKEKAMKILSDLIDFITKTLPLKNLIVFESKPDFADNTYFLFRKMIELGYNKKYKMYWILGDEKSDYNLPKNVYSVRRQFGTPLEKIKARYLIGRARYIIDCNRFIHKTSDRQVRVYLKHGLPMKSVPNYNLNVGKLDLISVPSESWIKKCAEEHEVDSKYIKPLGFPRNDILKPQNHNGINIIWMPTWISGNFSTEDEITANPLIREMPFGLPCIQTTEQIDKINGIFQKHNAFLYIRLHPAQDNTVIRITDKSNIIVCNDAFLKSQDTTLYKFLCGTDALISDYSSIYYDYLKLDKPIALITKYYKEYKDNCGFIKYTYEEFKDNFPANFINSYEELLEFFNNIFEGIDPAEVKRKEAMMKYMPPTDSDSSENIINYLIENFDF